MLSIKIIKSTFWSIQEPLKENTGTSIGRIINNLSAQTIYFSKKIGSFVYFAKERKGNFKRLQFRLFHSFIVYKIVFFTLS